MYFCWDESLDVSFYPGDLRLTFLNEMVTNHIPRDVKGLDANKVSYTVFKPHDMVGVKVTKHEYVCKLM